MLSFDIGPVYDPAGKNGRSGSVTLLLNGSPSGTFTIDAINDGKHAQQWQKVTLQVSTGNDRPTLGFAGADPKKDVGCAIDDVSFKFDR